MMTLNNELNLSIRFGLIVSRCHHYLPRVNEIEYYHDKKHESGVEDIEVGLVS
jgi:hypothetical protein